MKVDRVVFLAILGTIVVPNMCHAQGKAALAKEAAEYVMRKFGKEAAEVGAETLTRKIEALAVKHGDDVFIAVQKVGPRTLRIIEEAGEHGLESVKLMARFGDDAVWVIAKKNRLAIFVKYGDDAAESMMKHGEIAEPLLASFGKPAAGAFKAVSSQNGRRLAMLADEGQLAKIGRTPELLEVVVKHGDNAADFIWRNKGALTVAASLAAFITNPVPFLDGAKDLTKVVAETAAIPITEAAKNTNWTVVFVAGIGVIGLLVGLRQWSHRRMN